MATRNTIDPVGMLRERVASGGVRGTARELGVSGTYVSQVLLGQRAPGPKMLAALGLEVLDVTRVVRYRRAG